MTRASGGGSGSGRSLGSAERPETLRQSVDQRPAARLTPGHRTENASFLAPISLRELWEETGAEQGGCVAGDRGSEGGGGSGRGGAAVQGVARAGGGAHAGAGREDPATPDVARGAPGRHLRRMPPRLLSQGGSRREVSGERPRFVPAISARRCGYCREGSVGGGSPQGLPWVAAGAGPQPG